jgi:HPt (histidine-containing phosphotransfer) domain-containing protein
MKTSPHYSTIRKITKLRNSCAHNDAKYIENDGQNSTLIIELMDAHPDLFKKDGKQVLFMNGALTMVLDSFKSYLAEVEQALDEYEKWIRSGDKVAAAVGNAP